MKKNYAVSIHSAAKLKKDKTQNWRSTYIFLYNILDNQQISRKIKNKDSFHLLKLVSLKPSGLNILIVSVKQLK